MHLDPRHLAQLSVIVEAGSFQTAADFLNVTQPALSRNMRSLESRLGAPVFRREGRRSYANELGLRLARTGLAIRTAEQQAEIVAAQSARGTLGELRIGAPPIVAGKFLTTALSQFITDNEECNVELSTGTVPDLLKQLERGQIDIMLGPQSFTRQSKNLVFHKIIKDRVGILCRTEHPLAGKRRISTKMLENQTWIAHSKGSFLRQQTEAALLASGVNQIKIGLETDSIRTVLEVAAETDLLTTMPIATTTHYLEEKLIFLPFDHVQFHRPLGVIRRRDTTSTELEELFLKILKSSLTTSE